MSKKSFHQSSITKKIILAFGGLFLIAFLPVHLGINLFLLPITPDHKEIFGTAVEFMSTFPLVKVMEIVLFLAFIIHMIYGVVLQIQNWLSRPVGYKKRGTSELSPFSRFMIYTGLIILIFLVLHFINFYFIKLGLVEIPKGVLDVADKHDFYAMAYNLFQNPIYCIIYIVAFIPMGFHLYHAFQSAFQTLGLTHSKYTPIIQIIGRLYAIVIALGFMIIPAYFLIF